MSARFEVREQEPSELQRHFGVTKDIFVVWDTERDERVSFFGSYWTREQAERRIASYLGRHPEVSDD
jgi:hypothetical protein